MSRYISSRDWGGATQGHDGKVKPGVKKPRDGSEKRRWAKTKGKAKVISRKAATRFNRP